VWKVLHLVIPSDYNTENVTLNTLSIKVQGALQSVLQACVGVPNAWENSWGALTGSEPSQLQIHREVRSAVPVSHSKWYSNSNNRCAYCLSNSYTSGSLRRRTKRIWTKRKDVRGNWHNYCITPKWYVLANDTMCKRRRFSNNKTTTTQALPALAITVKAVCRPARWATSNCVIVSATASSASKLLCLGAWITRDDGVACWGKARNSRFYMLCY
jgi:hypothetical protein